MLANAAAANKYLDQTKIKFANDDDAGDEIEAADAHLRNMLFDVFGSQVNDWELDATLPDVEVPPIVKEYAAMWMAALRYAKLYSEETASEPPAYVIWLRSQVDGWLTGLRSGYITIEGLVSGISFNEDNFWPNSTDVYEGTTVSRRKFTMETVL